MTFTSGDQESAGKKPTAPTIGTATIVQCVDRAIDVTFTGSTYIGKGTVTYTVTSSPGGVTATGSSSPLRVTGLTAGTAYTFTVVATTNYGVSSDASSASNSVTAGNGPGAPTSATASAGNGQATVSWTAAAAGTGSTLYRVRTYLTSNSSLVKTNDGISGTSYTVTDLTNGTQYFFRVSAYNNYCENGTFSQTGNVTPVAPPYFPPYFPPFFPPGFK